MEPLFIGLGTGSGNGAHTVDSAASDDLREGARRIDCVRVEGLFGSSASKPYRLANPLNRLEPNIMQRPVHPDPEVLDSAPLSERWLFSGGTYQAA
jgi:hypothetical protein